MEHLKNRPSPRIMAAPRRKARLSIRLVDAGAGLRTRMRYAPFALRLWVPAWGRHVFPIRPISLN